MQQTCLLVKPSRRKWASTLKMILATKSIDQYNNLSMLYMVYWPKLLSQLHLVSIEMQIFNENTGKSVFSTKLSRTAGMFVSEPPLLARVLCFTSRTEIQLSNLSSHHLIYQNWNTLHESYQPIFYILMAKKILLKVSLIDI